MDPSRQLLSYSQIKLGKYGPIYWSTDKETDEFSRSYFNGTNFQLNLRIIEQLKQIKISVGMVQKQRKMINGLLVVTGLFVSVMVFAVLIDQEQWEKQELKTIQLVMFASFALFVLSLVIYGRCYTKKMCQRIENAITNLNKKLYSQNLNMVLVPEKQVNAYNTRNYKFIYLFQRVYR